MNLVPWIALGHVLAAMLFVAGYAGTAVATELARRSSDGASLRTLLAASGRFDGWFLIPGATLVGPLGLVLTAVNGYAWTSAWVVGSVAGWLFISALGPTIWRSMGLRVGRALDAGDDQAARNILNEPRHRALSQVQHLVLAVVVALMVLRPG
jgi:uncharacterized membrane protein